MQIRKISNGQNFGMKIPHTDALGELVRYWRVNGAKQKDINKILMSIKKTTFDSFSFQVDSFNTLHDMSSGAVKYSIIFKDNIKRSTFSNAQPYNLIKNLKEFSKKMKESLIKEKGPRAVTGKGIY